MPGCPTTAGWPGARVGALGHIAFHYTDSVGTRNQFSIAAQWLACTFPYRRFADILANACARLGADAGRYSFIAVDLHHLLLAGLPAHLCENTGVQFSRRKCFFMLEHAQKVRYAPSRQFSWMPFSAQKRGENGYHRHFMGWQIKGQLDQIYARQLRR
jgi:hypothetical protein